MRRNNANGSVTSTTRRSAFAEKLSGPRYVVASGRRNWNLIVRLGMNDGRRGRPRLNAQQNLAEDLGNCRTANRRQQRWSEGRAARFPEARIGRRSDALIDGRGGDCIETDGVWWGLVITESTSKNGG
jgi:hypothetical protein